MNKRRYVLTFIYVLSFLFLSLFVNSCFDSSKFKVDTSPNTNRAILGPLAYSTVKVYDAYTKELLYETKTNQQGYFSLDDANLKTDGLYIVEVSGGKDLDANDDGVQKDQVDMKGTIYALYIPSVTKYFNVTFLSDIVYRHIKGSIDLFSKEDLINYLNKVTSILIKDGKSYKEILMFDPLIHKNKLNFEYERFGKLIDDYHNGKDDKVISLDILYATDGKLYAGIDPNTLFEERKKFKLNIIKLGKSVITINGQKIENRFLFFDKNTELLIEISPDTDYLIKEVDGCDDVTKDGDIYFCKIKLDSDRDIKIVSLQKEVKLVENAFNISEANFENFTDTEIIVKSEDSKILKILNNLKAGDIIFSNDPSYIFVKKVIDIEKLNPNKFKISVEDVPLEEVIKSGSAYVKTFVIPTELQDAPINTLVKAPQFGDNAYIMKTEETEKTGYFYLILKRNNLEPLDAESKITITLFKKEDDAFSLELGTELVFKVKMGTIFYVDFRLGLMPINEFALIPQLFVEFIPSAFLKASLKEYVSKNVYLSLQDIQKEIPDKNDPLEKNKFKKYGRVIIPIGPLSVPLHFEFQPGVGMAMKLYPFEVSAKLEFPIRCSGEAGFIYFYNENPQLVNKFSCYSEVGNTFSDFISNRLKEMNFLIEKKISLQGYLYAFARINTHFYIPEGPGLSLQTNIGPEFKYEGIIQSGFSSNPKSTDLICDTGIKMDTALKVAPQFGILTGDILNKKLGKFSEIFKSLEDKIKGEFSLYPIRVSNFYGIDCKKPGELYVYPESNTIFEISDVEDRLKNKFIDEEIKIKITNIGQKSLKYYIDVDGKNLKLETIDNTEGSLSPQESKWLRFYLTYTIKESDYKDSSNFAKVTYRYAFITFEYESGPKRDRIVIPILVKIVPKLDQPNIVRIANNTKDLFIEIKEPKLKGLLYTAYATPYINNSCDKENFKFIGITYSGFNAIIAPLSEINFQDFDGNTYCIFVKSRTSKMDYDFPYRFAMYALKNMKIDGLTIESPVSEHYVYQLKLNGKLTGSVKDAVTQEPIQNVRVLLTNKNNPEDQKETYTDEEGNYYFEELLEGNYTVNFEKEGYLPASGEVEIKANETTIFPTVMSIDVNYSGNAVITGKVVDAVNRSGIEGAQVSIYEGINLTSPIGEPVVTITTQSDGSFSTEIPAGYYTVFVSKENYISANYNLTAIGGQEQTVEYALTPVLNSNEIRIVLTWGENPPDLDSHLVKLKNGQVEYHVYYANKNPTPEADLDVDDTDSFGPETITIHNLDPEATYKYYVHDYTTYSGDGTALANSGATVKVYWNNEVYTFYVPNGLGTAWKVFEIDKGVLKRCTSNCLFKVNGPTDSAIGEYMLPFELELFKDKKD